MIIGNPGSNSNLFKKNQNLQIVLFKKRQRIQSVSMEQEKFKFKLNSRTNIDINVNTQATLNGRLRNCFIGNDDLFQWYLRILQIKMRIQI